VASNAPGGLVVQLGAELQDLVHAGALQGADEEQRGEVDVLEVALRLLAQPPRLAFLVLHEVPLVHHQDHRAPAFLGLGGDAGVLIDAQLRWHR